jgi:hypothetical protein
MYQEPEAVNKMFEEIQSISDEARLALNDPEMPREDLLNALSVSNCVIETLGPSLSHWSLL